MSSITTIIMWFSLLSSLHSFLLINAQGFHRNEVEVSDPTSESPDMVYRSRCTRRFTPGVCEEPAATVWTFVFHLQNCTERLGCPVSHRTNRFSTYRKCMRRCHPLIDIYLQILASENYTSKVYLRNQPGAIGRREGDAILDLNDTGLELNEDGDDKEEVGSTNGEPLFNLYYRDDSDAEVSLPPDIDYAAGREKDVTEYVYED